MKEAHVWIQFDMTKLGQDKLHKLFQAEKLLNEIGISFDTGGGFGGRDWEWDWSLKGPVKVYFKELKEDFEKRKNNESQSDNKGMPIVQEAGC
jgi:hypothetical protein